MQYQGFCIILQMDIIYEYNLYNKLKWLHHNHATAENTARYLAGLELWLLR
jgi:hypothetical protein